MAKIHPQENFAPCMAPSFSLPVLEKKNPISAPNTTMLKTITIK